MQNAQLNKQRWTTEKKESTRSGSLRSARRSESKTPIGEKLQNGQIYRGVTKKKRDSLFFLLRRSNLNRESVLNIEVSIYTGAVYTEQQGQKKVENKGQQK